MTDMADIKVLPGRERENNDAYVSAVLELCRLNGVSVGREQFFSGLPGVDGKIDEAFILKAVDRLGLEGSYADYDIKEVPSHLFPFLMSAADGKYIIVKKIKDGKAEIDVFNDADCDDTVELDKLQEERNGLFLFVYPKVSFASVDAQSSNKGYHWLWSPIKANWKIYRAVGAASLIINLLAIATAIFAMQVYDRVVPTQAYDTLWILASGVGLAIIIEILLRLSRSTLIDITGRNIDLESSEKIFDRLVHMRLQHRPAAFGVLANQVREFSKIREFITSDTISSLCDIPLTLIYVGVIFILGGPLGFVTLSGIALTILPGLLMKNSLARTALENARETSLLNGLLYESITALETIKSSRAEDRVKRSYQNLLTQTTNTAVRTRRVTARISQIVASIQKLTYASVIVYGVYLIGGGNLTVGGLIACTILSGRAMAPMGQVAALTTKWQQVKAAVQSLDDILATPQERPSGANLIRIREPQGHYAIHNLRFHYDLSTRATVEIANLSISGGEHVALLGGNGSGKSSFLRLLGGLYTPNEGCVLLDNLNLLHIDHIDRQRNIGYLPQSVSLLQGTIRENLLLDYADRSDAEVLECLDAVGLGAFIRSNPQGLDAVLRGNGSVSGGQRQAIGLARIILQDPKIVLLDEPTAAFDQVAEQKFIDFMKTWMVGRTVVLCTHKKELLGLTDRVLIMKNGRIERDGSLPALLDERRKALEKSNKLVSME